MQFIPKLGLRGLRRGAGRATAVRAANASRDAKDFPLAAQQYGEIIRTWGAEFSMLVQWGNMLKDSGAYQEAETAYAEALRLRPHDADCHLQLGHLLKLAGHPERAKEFYQEAMRLDPSQPHAELELEEIAARARRAAEPDEDAAPLLPPPIAPNARADLAQRRIAGNLAWRRG